LGAIELLPVLLSLTNLASPLSSSTLGGGVLRPEDLDTFISDLVERFPSQEEQLDDVLGPVIRLLLFHPSLAKPEGIAGGDSGWRTIAAALNALVHHPAIAKMVARLEEWCPRDAAANEIERVSLLGPLARLGVFYREWVSADTTMVRLPHLTVNT
jgi:ubiquitin conjugation factor E4 B